MPHHIQIHEPCATFRRCRCPCAIKQCHVCVCVCVIVFVYGAVRENVTPDDAVMLHNCEEGRRRTGAVEVEKYNEKNKAMLHRISTFAPHRNIIPHLQIFLLSTVCLSTVSEKMPLTQGMDDRVSSCGGLLRHGPASSGVCIQCGRSAVSASAKFHSTASKADVIPATPAVAALERREIFHRCDAIQRGWDARSLLWAQKHLALRFEPMWMPSHSIRSIR